MSELQSFLNAVPVAQGPGPRNSGAGGAQFIQGGGNLLQAKQNLDATRERKKDEAAKAQTQADVAQAYLFDEEIKRREPLREAGMAPERANTSLLTEDAKRAIDALDQASAKGMGHSTRNALERSFHFQSAVMKNPAAAKELAAAYGIGDNSIERDTLASLEKQERETLHSEANAIRNVLREEGFTDHQGSTDEQVLELWQEHPLAIIDRRIKKNKRIALDQTSSIEARRPAAAQAISLASANVSRELDRVQSQYAATKGSMNMGTNGITLSLAEELNFAVEDMIAQVKREYPDFTQQTDAFATFARQQATARVSARTSGLALDSSEHSAQVVRPVELELKKLNIESRILENANNEVRGLQNVFEFRNDLFRNYKAIAELQDEMLVGKAVKKLRDNPALEQTQAQIIAALDRTSTMVSDILNPEAGESRKVIVDSVDALAIVANEGIANNQGKFKSAVLQLSSAYDSMEELDPERAELLSTTLLTLADEPAFAKQAKNSAAVKKLLKPIRNGIRKEIISSLQAANNEINKDKVLSTTYGGLPWKKLGQSVVLDILATNKAGVPQIRLINGADLNTQDKVRYAKHIDRYNESLRITQNRSQYELLQTVSGSSTISEAMNEILRSDEGISLEGLDPTRTSDIPVPSGTTAQDVQDSLVGVQ